MYRRTKPNSIKANGVPVFDFDVFKQELAQLMTLLESLPPQLELFGYILLDPEEKYILALPACFAENTIPVEYVISFLSDRVDCYLNQHGKVNVLSEIGTTTCSKKWSRYAVYFGGITFAGKTLIVGEEIKGVGFKALSLRQIISAILGIDAVAGYEVVELRLLSPLGA